MDVKWPIRKALMILAASVLVNAAFSFGLYSYYNRWKQAKRTCERYKISAIVQTGPCKEALKTVYLAELLGLSVDVSKNLYACNLHEAAKALLTSPLIKYAEVKRIAPSSLYVDYEVRRPLAWLSDYKNIAIDREGYLFPVAPFFSPQEMPEIYLGLPPFGADADAFGREGGKWRSPLQNKYLNLGLDLLQTFEGSPWKRDLRLKRIDVSNAYAPSLGKREIVLFTEEEVSIKKDGRELTFVFPKILRLAPKDYAQQLQNFFALSTSMLEDYKQQLAGLDEGANFSPRIIDLRISSIAFVQSQ